MRIHEVEECSDSLFQTETKINKKPDSVQIDQNTGYTIHFDKILELCLKIEKATLNEIRKNKERSEEDDDNYTNKLTDMIYLLSEQKDCLIYKDYKDDNAESAVNKSPASVMAYGDTVIMVLDELIPDNKITKYNKKKIRAKYLPCIKHFFEDSYGIKDFSKVNVAFNQYYSNERNIKDFDNIGIKPFIDMIIPYMAKDDSPFCCNITFNAYFNDNYKEHTEIIIEGTD